jgi:hypothetical protein
MLAFGAAACASRPADTTTTPAAAPAPRGGQTGGGTAREAVDAFLASVRAQDVQATSAIWGTKDGPARDNGKMTRTELEKRVLIMQCFLAHDASRIVNDLPAAEGKRTVRVELTNAGRARQTNFTVVQGPRSRWYVESADLDPVKDFCRNPS